MRKFNILILLLLFVLASSAQDTLFVGNSNYSVTILDTAANASFSITDSLYNGGITPVSDSVTFGAKVNSVQVTAPRFSSTIFTPVDTLFPNVNRALTFTFTSDTAPPFVIGTNAVVIWPIIHNNSSNHIFLIPSDSIRITASYYPLSIADAPLTKIYLYQVKGMLIINFGDAENLVQQVRIYDILGQNVYTSSADKPKNIPCTGWNSGIYLCEINTFSGEKKTIKFRLE